LRAIDLNADLGEGAGTDAELLKIVSSANIACGGHAGDTQSMRTAIRDATANGVAVGAHPGFKDKANFGRVRLQMEPGELAAQITSQLVAFKRIADAQDATIAHMKLHGALANMAAEDADIATTCFIATKDVLGPVSILAIDNSAQVTAAEALGLPFIREAYADRAYMADGLLAPRTEPGAVLMDPEKVVAQCVRLATRGEIIALDGTVIATKTQSICIHGDTPDAVMLAHKVAEELKKSGVVITSPR